MGIHPTAIVSPEAELHPTVEVGPFSYIGPGVMIGEGTVISSCVRIEGPARIGKRNRIFHGAALGLPPQDFRWKGEESLLIIGDGNVIREFVTIHRAVGEGEATVVGNENFIMAYAHLGHNVRVGDRVILVNGAQVGGHAEIGDGAYVSSHVLIHQFARVGAYATVGGGSRVSQDVLPFMMAVGFDAAVVGVNRVGLRRAGFSRERIDRIAEAYRIIYREGHTPARAFELLEEAFPGDPDIEFLLEFYRKTKRGIIRRSGN